MRYDPATVEGIIIIRTNKISKGNKLWEVGSFEISQNILPKTEMTNPKKNKLVH